MADAVAVFGEPEAEVRLGRDKWTDSEDAVKPLDDLLALFAKSFAKQDAGYKRSVSEFDYSKAMPEVPAADAKNEDGSAVYASADDHTKAVTRRVSRIAERLNERAEATGTKAHARVIRGKLHLVTGPKPVITRNRKPAENGSEAS